MANKRRNRNANSFSSAPGRHAGAGAAAPSHNRLYLAIGGGILALVAVVAIGFVALGGTGSGSSSGLASGESIHQAAGGQWTNVTPDRLAQMLQTKDFTLLNVKTPYSGEISGTDLYIPYDQIPGRASELPSAKNAKILVYCRSGVESAQAAQSLLDLGYTNVWNLDGGMTAWQSSGRTLVNLNRS